MYIFQSTHEVTPFDLALGVCKQTLNQEQARPAQFVDVFKEILYSSTAEMCVWVPGDSTGLADTKFKCGSSWGAQTQQASTRGNLAPDADSNAIKSPEEGLTLEN